jgi:hypothetical protein
MLKSIILGLNLTQGNVPPTAVNLELNSVTTPVHSGGHFLPALHKSQLSAFSFHTNHRELSLLITCAELFLSQMSSDLLKEHLKAVADRLTDKSTRNAKVLKPSKKSDSIKKTERANNYIGWFYFLS